MHPAIAYLLKMLLCSAILLGYYWAALRNERFHQWNRFYLLAALLLSVLVPFLNIPLLQPHQPTAVIDMLSALPWNNVLVKPTAPTVWGWEQFSLLITSMISGILLLHLLISIWKVVKLHRSNSYTYIHNVSVVITEEASAPFSFFKWLFWRSDIDPDTNIGQRMLQHELTHINEKHSADKLFAEIVLIVFWMNPLFWIIRRELFAIHEFLADRKAIESQDGAAFAAMILQATTGTPAPTLSNPFFSSHLKRRLQMITTSYKPKYSYLRRISGLVLMLATTAVLIVSMDTAYAQNKKKTPPPPPPTPTAPANGQWTVLPDSIRKAEVLEKDGQPFIAYEMKDGRKFTYELKEAGEKGYFIPPPPPAPKATEALSISGTTDPEKQPLIIYAGLEISNEQMKKINAEQIATINVLKGENAIKVYGNKARNGAIIIEPKTNVQAQQEEVVVRGYPLKKDTAARASEPGVQQGAMPKVIVVDGKRVADLNNISPNDIATVNVLKGEMAVAKYGQEAEAGAIEIVTKTFAASFDKVFTKTEQMPKFPGGQTAWRKYLEQHLKYPDKAQEEGTKGSVTVQFIVDTDGNLHDVKALNDPGNGLAQEAVRILAKGPKWEAAVQNGQKVAARTTQIITFWLE